jgi:hypothetical protein
MCVCGCYRVRIAAFQLVGQDDPLIVAESSVVCASAVGHGGNLSADYQEPPVDSYGGFWKNPAFQIWLGIYRRPRTG